MDWSRIALSRFALGWVGPLVRPLVRQPSPFLLDFSPLFFAFITRGAENIEFGVV